MHANSYTRFKVALLEGVRSISMCMQQKKTMLPSIDAQADIAIEQTQKLLYPHLQCRKMLLSFLRTGFSQDSVLPQLVVLELLQWAGRCELRELQMQRGAERLCRR